MNKRNFSIPIGITLFFSLNIILAKSVDSLKIKSPVEAAKYSFIFPGGGQIYNGKWFKSAIIIGCEIAAINRWITNREIYNNYEALSEDSPSKHLSKRRYLEKRNRNTFCFKYTRRIIIFRNRRLYNP